MVLCCMYTLCCTRMMACIDRYRFHYAAVGLLTPTLPGVVVLVGRAASIDLAVSPNLHGKWLTGVVTASFTTRRVFALCTANKHTLRLPEQQPPVSHWGQ